MRDDDERCVRLEHQAALGVVGDAPGGLPHGDHQRARLADRGLGERLADQVARRRNDHVLDAQLAVGAQQPVEELDRRRPDHLADQTQPTDLVGADDRRCARADQLVAGGDVDRLRHDAQRDLALLSIREGLGGDHDEEVVLVAVQRRDHALGVLDARLLELMIIGRVADHVEQLGAEILGEGADAVLVGVHDHEGLAHVEELGDHMLARVARAADDDVLTELVDASLHASLLENTL